MVVNYSCKLVPLELPVQAKSLLDGLEDNPFTDGKHEVVFSVEMVFKSGPLASLTCHQWFNVLGSKTFDRQTFDRQTFD